MSGVNKVIVLGRLGQDPEVKQVNNSNTVCRISVATSEAWKGKDGQAQERTEWHRIVIWGKLAEICGKYLSKGRQVYVEGRLETRSWEDDKGQKKYATEIVASKVEFIGGGTTIDRTDAQSFPEDSFGDAPSFDGEEELPF